MPANEERSAPDGASVILYAPNQVLLYKKDGRPKLFPHRWAIFGGGIEEGETPTTTVCRELQVELGYLLTPEDLEFLGLFQVLESGYKYQVHYYRSELKQDFWDILLNLHSVRDPEREGEGIALFSHPEVEYLNLVCQDRMALERHFRGREFGFIS